MIWPAVYWKQFWQILRDAIQAQIDFGKAIGDGAPQEEIDAARVKARGLRIQCETIVRSASLDPRARRSKTLPAAATTAEKLHENAAEMLAIEAAQAAHHPDAAQAIATVMSSADALLREVNARITET